MNGNRSLLKQHDLGLNIQIMIQLSKGDYYGEKRNVFDYQDIIVINTVTAPKEAPLHYHENAYFSYFIKGVLQEKNKKESYYCSDGMLLYHHSQDPHQNKNENFVHNVNIELTKNCFNKYGIKTDTLSGSAIVKNQALVIIFTQVYKEIIINDNASRITVEGLVLQALGILERSRDHDIKLLTPGWVKKIKEYLHAENDSLNLEATAKELGLHPVYLSQAFPKYFKVSFGDYIRKIRLQKATALLRDKRHSLSSITYECGFSDQSHFIRCFKKSFQMTPLKYRKSILYIK